MNRRIQRALDGELSLDRLSPAELEELATWQVAIDQTLAGIPDPGPGPDMAGAVMWRIARTPDAAPIAAPRRGHLAGVADALRWFWQPHPIQFRPAAAGAVFALLVAAGLALWRDERPGATAVAEAEATRQLVQFRIGVEGAKDVALVGDFSGWESRYPLDQVAPGVWSTTVRLEPGVYDYAFVVDGTVWRLDPLAPAVEDGFGGANSRVSVLAPERATRT